jgi:hypothetical protein
MKKILVAILLGVSNVIFAGDLKLFQSYVCSSFPDGTFTQQTLWLSCCIDHDRAYWKGGTSDEREEADKALSSCIKNVGEPDIANLMLAGVRVGGTPYLPTSFRWAYGWPYLNLRGYKALNAADLQEVAAIEKREKDLDSIHPILGE